MSAAEASASRRGLAVLRATGPAGIASAVVIAAATFAALFGPVLAPYDPNLPNLSLSWAGPPAVICSGMTSRAATCCPGWWPARSARCSGR